MKEIGAPNELLAPFMGHRDTRMLERVYGRPDPAELSRQLAASIGVSPPPNGTHTGQTPRTDADASEVSDSADEPASRNSKTLVPRDRIELPTRGFSILCSTN